MITGNAEKFHEVRELLPFVEQMDVSLPEIQSMDPHEVVTAKLNAALEHRSANFIVEDTSLSLSCLNGLPGPLVKWFLKAIGSKGLYDMANRFGDFSAIATAIVGHANAKGEIRFFEGTVKGKIVVPKAVGRMGWDSVFQPEGHSRTFAEMNINEKNEVSPRSIAVRKLKLFLDGGSAPQ